MFTVPNWKLTVMNKTQERSGGGGKFQPRGPRQVSASRGPACAGGPQGVTVQEGKPHVQGQESQAESAQECRGEGHDRRGQAQGENGGESDVGKVSYNPPPYPLVSSSSLFLPRLLVFLTSGLLTSLFLTFFCTQGIYGDA